MAKPSLVMTPIFDLSNQKIMVKKSISSIILTISFLYSMAQTQIVKGTILDKQSEMPIIGAVISWITAEGNVLKGAVTDLNGNFRLAQIPVGRHSFKVNYIGYEPSTIANIVVTSGKEVSLELVLEESVHQLKELIVLGETDKDKSINEMAVVSARQFNLEEVNRFSGGRSDVARLVGNFAGVSTADDSRNDIVIRGNNLSNLFSATLYFDENNDGQRI